MLLPLLFLALQLLVHAAPLRIYLLVGQSNMEGKGSMKHLEQLLSNDLTKSTYQHYGTPANYSSKSNVYIYYQDEGQVHQGPLRVGYGMPINETFGPELEFGWVVGDDAAQQDPPEATDVLLIKCAWGGKSLGVDFRSPSRGVGNYTYCNDDGCFPYHPSFYGQYYRRTIETVQSVLHNLPVVNGKQYEQYELAGLVWFQGWNDVIDDGMVKEYSDNLIHFIRDVRLDLDEPGLPIIVGEMGQGGPVPPKHGLPHVALRRQMRLATQSFPLSSSYVMTSPYINAEGNSYNGDYHYYGTFSLLHLKVYRLQTFSQRDSFVFFYGT